MQELVARWMSPVGQRIRKQILEGVPQVSWMELLRDLPGSSELEACSDLRGIDLSGADLSGADLVGVNLEFARLDGAVLRGAKLQISRLVSASLRGVNAPRAQFSNAEAAGACFDDAILSDADFTEADLTGVSFRGAKLDSAWLIHSKLMGADFSGADLTGTQLRNARLDGAVLPPRAPRVEPPEPSDAARVAGVGSQDEGPEAEVLEVAVSLEPNQPPVRLSLFLQDHVVALERRGYRRVRIKGLGALKVRTLRGERGTLEVIVDPDVYFLLAYYRALEEVLSQSRSAYLHTYVVDGCIEISSFVQPEEVRVRMGLGFGTPFEPPFEAATVMRSDEYLAMWRSIAAAIARR